MSEYVPTHMRPVSVRTLRRAVIRLDLRKHPQAAEAISRELARRETAELRRAA